MFFKKRTHSVTALSQTVTQADFQWIGKTISSYEIYLTEQHIRMSYNFMFPLTTEGTTLLEQIVEQAIAIPLTNWARAEVLNAGRASEIRKYIATSSRGVPISVCSGDIDLHGGGDYGGRIVYIYAFEELAGLFFYDHNGPERGKGYSGIYAAYDRVNQYFFDRRNAEIRIALAETEQYKKKAELEQRVLEAKRAKDILDRL